MIDTKLKGYLNDPNWKLAEKLAYQLRYEECQRVVQKILDKHSDRRTYSGYREDLTQ